MMNTWLMRLPVQIPVSLRTTSPINSSVCKLPFINTATSPDLARATAFSAAA